jgi:hypothetical protein
VFRDFVFSVPGWLWLSKPELFSDALHREYELMQSVLVVFLGVVGLCSQAPVRATRIHGQGSQPARRRPGMHRIRLKTRASRSSSIGSAIYMASTGALTRRSEPEGHLGSQKISGREKALSDAIPDRRARARAGRRVLTGRGQRRSPTSSSRTSARGRQRTRRPSSTKSREVPPVDQHRLSDDAAAGDRAAVAPQKLPTLPEDLEYRFVGRHLILRDTKPT